MTKSLDKMTVNELEQEAFKLTAERVKLRDKQLAVQSVLGRKLEDERISKLLGRDVQIVTAQGIESVDE